MSEIMLGDNYADDLPQMPVVRRDDRLLFYAQGPLTWKRLVRSENDTLIHVQVQHPYSLSGFYFVTNDARFSDIEIPKADNAPVGPLKTTYIERLFHEQEIINPGETGRAFLGENFASNRKQTFNFDLNGIVSDSKVKMYSVFAAQTTGGSSQLNYAANDSALRSDGADIIQKVNSLTHDHYMLSRSVKEFKLKGTVDVATFKPFNSDDSCHRWEKCIQSLLQCLEM